MTEADWLKADDVFTLLDYGAHKSERKARLFALACYRRVRGHCVFPESLDLARIVKRFVDGNATSEDLKAGAERLRHAIEQSPVPDWVSDAWEYRAYRYWPDKIALHAAEARVDTFAAAEAAICLGVGEENRPAREQAKQSRALLKVVHCIFGNPFRPVTVEPSWLTWKDGTVVKLAQRIYEERAFERLPVLADALEEAGCCDEQILSHCRGPGPHARGCFVLDVLLQKS